MFATEGRAASGKIEKITSSCVQNGDSFPGIENAAIYIYEVN
ncbi:MAG: hypothetical protein QOH31_723 [Verrucomicrobiota bacterium]